MDEAARKLLTIGGIEMWVNSEFEAFPMIDIAEIGHLATPLISHSRDGRQDGRYGACHFCGEQYDPHNWGHLYGLPKILDLCPSCYEELPAAGDFFKDRYSDGLKYTVSATFAYGFFYNFMSMFED